MSLPLPYCEYVFDDNQLSPSSSFSQNDTSASLPLQNSTPQKLSTSNEEEVKDCVDGSVIQNTIVTPADITPQQLISIRNSKQHNLDKTYLNKEANLAIPKPLGKASFVPTCSKNDSGVVKEPVNSTDTYAELMDRLKKQRLVSAEAQLKIAAYTNRPLGAYMQDLKYIDYSSDSRLVREIVNYRFRDTYKINKKDNRFSLKLPTVKEETESNQDGYSVSISTDEKNHKEMNATVEVHSEGQESQKIMDNVGQGNIQKVNGNMEIMGSVDTVEVSHYLTSMAYIKKLEETLFSNTTFTSYILSPELTMENTRCTHVPSCEEVSGFRFNPNTDEGQKCVKKHIVIYKEIVKQLTKMLVFACQNEPQFLYSELHLEGEKMLLIAKTKWDVLLNHLQRVAEPARETLAQIVLEKFGCQINLPKYEQLFPNVKHYYMCILEHKTTVYSTNIKEANEYGYVHFGDRFIFENVTNTFDIKISLYSLRVKLPERKCIKFCVIRRRPQVARMTLIGVVQIGLLNVKHRNFPFQNPNNVKGPDHQLLTTVEATLNWPKPVQGFLIMGFSQSDRQPIWHKRWCVLEEGQLRYFNFPSDELRCSPIGIVDVRECALSENSSFEYMTRKTLMLAFRINLNEVWRMFICADNNVDQMMWLETLNASIKIRNDWRLLMK